MTALRYISTEKIAVTTGAAAEAAIANTTPTSKWLAVAGAVAFHAVVALDAANVAASDANAYFPLGEIYILELPPNHKLSLRGAADGNVWVSEVSKVAF